VKKYIVLLLFLLSGCGSPQLGTIQVNNINAYVELAVTPEQREQGLMYRRQLEKDQGLLMVFEAPQQVSLWMLNTLIPLDVGYFNQQGELLATTQMLPDGGKQLHHSPPETFYVLEMNRDWFNRYGLKPGARLTLPKSFKLN
jgi:uncharacterized membrane protein (UPF0127 family)